MEANTRTSDPPVTLETLEPYTAGVAGVGRHPLIAVVAEWGTLALLALAAAGWWGTGGHGPGEVVAGLALAWGAAVLMLAMPGRKGVLTAASVLLAWLFCFLGSGTQGDWTAGGFQLSLETALLLSAVVLAAVGYVTAPPSRRWILAQLIAVVPLSILILPPLIAEGRADPLPWKSWVYALCLVELAGLFRRRVERHRNRYLVAGWAVVIGFVLLGALMRRTS